MVSYNKFELVEYLRENQLLLVDTNFLRDWTGLTNQQSLASSVQTLERNGVLERAEKGKYLVRSNLGNDFLLANLLYSPSYVSLVTALNLYGILPQFPTALTSVTTKRKKEKHVAGKQFMYYKMSPKLYWGYVKKEGALIATAEKALLDVIYLQSKGILGVDMENLDLSLIDKKVFGEYSQNFPQTKKFVSLVGEVI